MKTIKPTKTRAANTDGEMDQELKDAIASAERRSGRKATKREIKLLARLHAMPSLLREAEMERLRERARQHEIRSAKVTAIFEAGIKELTEKYPGMTLGEAMEAIELERLRAGPRN